MNNVRVSRAQTTYVSRGEHLQFSQEKQSPLPAGKTVVFTPTDLHQCLYRRDEVTVISKDDLKGSLQHREGLENPWSNGRQQRKSTTCQTHSSRQMRKETTPVNNNNIHWPYALKSFPSEVCLCKSGIPGAGYGVCSRQFIPTGTWIGPYEGVKVKPDQVVFGTDASYMWEIYHDGKLVYYIDGHDENNASWMRYIRCARHRGEQNMYAFQYYGNIYYRAFKDLPPGTELLVWYDDKYPQYMGIPLEIRETFHPSPIDARHHPKITDALSPENLLQGEVPHSPSSSLSTVHRSFESAVSKSYQTRDQQHVKRRSSQSLSMDSERSRTSLTEETDRDFVCQAPLSHAEKGMQKYSYDSVSQSVSLGTGGQVQQRITTNGLHDVSGSKSDECEREVSMSEEIHSKYPDEEDISSDNSDGSYFNCGQCGKSFAQRSVLQIHVCPRRPHKPYHCGHCNQSFDYPNELRMHAVIHAGEKPFKCGYCSRSFAGATTLHNHVRTHTGEKPFTCERCGKNFTQASQLHRHEGIPGDCIP